MSPTEKPWTRGPTAGKIWSGVSAHPTLRTRPKATVEISKMNLKEATAFAKTLYDADLGDGYTSHVTEVEEMGTISVRGVIMKRGREVGSFERTIGSDEPAPLQRVFDRSLVAPPPRPNPAIVVSHDQLYMNPSHQSKGVGDRFNAHAVAEYQKVGVDRIVLHAGDTVGGFAWARQGFRYDEGGDFHGDKRRREFLNKQLDRMKSQTNIPLVRPHAKELKRDIAAVQAAIDAGEDVQPIHVASIGEKYIRYEARDDHANNYTTWPGKKVLLGTSWPAVYYFDGSQAISASALSLEHAELRPAFRTAVEEFYNKNHSKTDGKFVSGASSNTTAPDSLMHWGAHTVDARILKHEGAQRVADAMTSVEKFNVIDTLDYELQTGETIGSLIEYAADIGMPTGMTAGIAAQLAAVSNWAEIGRNSNKINEVYKSLDDHEGRVSNGVSIPESIDQLSKDLTKTTGVTQVAAFVSFINGSWAHSATSVESVMMQFVAATAKQLPGALDALKRSEHGAEHLRYVAPGVEKLRKALHAIHEATYRVSQEALAASGLTELTVYRGVQRGRIPGGTGTPASIVAQPNPLSSWTTAIEVARRFATGDDVFKTTVPASQVYSIAAKTGNGSWEEREVILLGNQITAERLTFKEIQELAAERPEVVFIDEDDADWIKQSAKNNSALTAAAALICEHGSLTAACHDTSCRPPTSGGTGGSKPGGKFPNGADPEPHAAELRRHYEIGGSGTNYRPIVANIAQHFRDLVPTHPEVRVRFPISVAKIIATEGFKSQHETNNSLGLFDRELREKAETEMFGVAKTQPVYGYIGMGHKDNTTNMQKHYGQIAAVLHDDVNERTTVTRGDSLASRTTTRHPAPVPLDDVHTVDNRRLFVASANGHDGIEHNVPYVEAQIHGIIRPSDIRSLILPQPERDGKWQGYTMADWRDMFPDVEIRVAEPYEQFAVEEEES